MTNFNGNAGEGKMTKQDPSCKFDPGVMVPIIDPMRCEGKRAVRSNLSLRRSHHPDRPA
jgi:hypothetical protein